ncbi:MAG: 4Fe-4S cluster-binding domain-containing protein, partial [Oscillospiraceae bacterium]|nr:4Fe-4S cluster-binding domain-containing protein [Oscillospiraceae bacterium]
MKSVRNTEELLLRFWHFPVVTLGPGRRLGLWLQGCSIHCPGCVAPENQPFDRRFAVPLETLMAELAPVLAECPP